MIRAGVPSTRPSTPRIPTSPRAWSASWGGGRQRPGAGRGGGAGSGLASTPSGCGEEHHRGPNKASTLQDQVEAVIGAVHLSGGIEVASEVADEPLDPLDRGPSALVLAGLGDLAPGARRRARLRQVPEHLIQDEALTTRRPSPPSARTPISSTGRDRLIRRKPSSPPPRRRTACCRPPRHRRRPIDAAVHGRRGRNVDAAVDDQPTPRELLEASLDLMPELLEVEVVCAGPARHVLGAVIDLGRGGRTLVGYAAGTWRGPGDRDRTDRPAHRGRRRRAPPPAALHNGDARLATSA